MRRNRVELGIDTESSQRISESGARSDADLEMLRSSDPRGKSLTAELKKAADRRDWDEAITAFRKGPHRPNPVNYNAILNAANKCNRLKEGFELHEEMKQLGYPRNVVTFTPLLDVASREGTPDLTKQVVYEMQSVGIALQPVHFNLVIKACIRAANADQALVVLKEMRDCAVQPNVITYTSVLCALRRAQKFDQSEAVIREMQADGVAANKFFLEEHVSCVLRMPDLGSLKNHGLSEIELQAAIKVIEDARAAGVGTSRFMEFVERQLREGLVASQDTSDWVRVLCEAEAGAEPREYYWDRTSGRTQWELPDSQIRGDLMSTGHVV